MVPRLRRFLVQTLGGRGYQGFANSFQVCYCLPMAVKKPATFLRARSESQNKILGPQTANRRKRLVIPAVVGALVLGLSIAPHHSQSPAYASGTCPGTLSGAGTDASPCLVTTAEDLNKVRNDLTLRYRQTADIDLISFASLNDGKGWEPIGPGNSTATSFQSVFDGGDFTISNLTIQRPGEEYVGLFGRGRRDSVIKNVRLADVDIQGKTRVGSLVGRTSGEVLNSSATGTVSAEEERVGGLVGQGSGDANLAGQLVFIGDVAGGTDEAASSTGDRGIGGIVGRMSGSTSLSDAYVRGTVSGNRAGGLAGSSSTNPSDLQNMYAAVEIKTTRDSDKTGGAVVGRVDHCEDTIADSVYWDKDLNSRAFGTVTTRERTDGQVTCPPTLDAKGLTTAEMTGSSADEKMDGLFDLEDTPWRTITIPDDDYPVFEWQRGDEISVTVVVEDGDSAVPGAAIRFASRDLLFRDVTGNTAENGTFTTSVYSVSHQEVAATATIGGQSLTTSSRGPFVNEETVTLILLLSNMTVDSATSNGITTSNETVNGVNRRTFIAGDPDASLSSIQLRDGLLAGNVTIVASGDITLSNWSAPALIQTRQLVLQAGEDVTTSTALGLNATNNPVVVSATAGGDISLSALSAITVGDLDAGGLIEVTTATGNLTLTGVMSSGATTTSALVLGAGTSSAVRDETGGNLVVSVPPGRTINQMFIVGSNGSSQLFTGAIDNSITGLIGTARFSALFSDTPSPAVQAGTRTVFVRGPDTPGGPNLSTASDDSNPATSVQTSRTPTTEVPAPRLTPRQGRLAFGPPDTSPVRQPVVRVDRAFNPNVPSKATVNGAPINLLKTPVGSDAVSIIAGAFQFGVQVSDGGEVQTDTPSQSPELFVPRGQSAAVSGEGSYPGSFVQLWLPGNGIESRELARIPVRSDGTFTSDVSFQAGAMEMPVPIGRQVLQVVGYDEQGNQTVVDMTINIGQGAPAPEPNRQAGALPALGAGQLFATSGGLPENVSVTGVVDSGSILVEGSGWVMGVNTDRDSGAVENQDGNFLVRLEQSSIGTTFGNGFLPGTLATVWLFSEPTLMATVTVDDNGEFSSEFLVDARLIAPGEHTLQVQGVGSDGYIKAANLGVLVEQPVEVTAESASGLLWWIVGAFLLVLLFLLLLLARRRRSQEQ